MSPSPPEVVACRIWETSNTSLILGMKIICVYNIPAWTCLYFVVVVSGPALYDITILVEDVKTVETRTRAGKGMVLFQGYG
jgi:hypothetical protein